MHSHIYIKLHIYTYAHKFMPAHTHGQTIYAHSNIYTP